MLAAKKIESSGIDLIFFLSSFHFMPVAWQSNFTTYKIFTFLEYYAALIGNYLPVVLGNV
jgi:hypothetical protein